MAATLYVGDAVQALDRERGVWTDANIVDVDELQRRALVRYRGWSSQWDEWHKIGIIKDEVKSTISALDIDGLRSIYEQASKEKCIPGPSRFNPTVGQSISVLLLEHFDSKQELSDMCLAWLKKDGVAIRGDCFIRSLEILVRPLYQNWNEKGFLRSPISEKLFPRHQPADSLPLSECRKLRMGDIVYFTSMDQMHQASVQTNDPFLGCVILKSKSTLTYEQLLTKIRGQKYNIETETREENVTDSELSDDSLRDPDWEVPAEPESLDTSESLAPKSTPVENGEHGRKRKRNEITSTPIRQKKLTTQRKKKREIQIIATGKGVTVEAPQHIETLSDIAEDNEDSNVDILIDSTHTAGSSTRKPTDPIINSVAVTAIVHSHTITQELLDNSVDARAPDEVSSETTEHTGNTIPESSSDTTTPDITQDSHDEPIIDDDFPYTQDDDTIQDEDSTVQPTASTQVSADLLRKLVHRIDCLESTVENLKSTVIVMSSEIKQLKEKGSASAYHTILTNTNFWLLRPADIPIPLTNDSINEKLEHQEDNPEELASEGTSNRCALAREYLNRTFTLRELYQRNVWDRVNGGVVRQPFNRQKVDKLLDVCFSYYPSAKRSEDTREITYKLNDHNRQIWCKRLKNVVLPPLP